MDSRTRKGVRVRVPRTHTFTASNVEERINATYLQLLKGETASSGAGRFGSGASKAPKSVKSSLSRKEGYFRAYLSGKRVPSSARCGVGPADVTLNTDEVGVPSFTAETLTRPVRVGAHNLKEIRDMVRNTTKVKFVRSDAGVEIQLAGMSKEERRSLDVAVGWVVHRSLQDGDLVIVNRYPTLHRGSWMAAYARIIPGMTIRLPTSVTPSYNADFDGDEMQIHVVQTLEAYAELEILLTSNNTVSAQNHTPTVFGIQNVPLGLWVLTHPDTLFTRDEALRLITTWALNRRPDDERMQSLPAPAVGRRGVGRRWEWFWTGKQLISMALPETLHFFKKGGGDETSMFPEEGSVLVRRGTILTGRLEKRSAFGAGGLMQHVLLQTNSQRMVRALDAIRRLVQPFMTHFRGHTMGFTDLLPSTQMFIKVRHLVASTLGTLERNYGAFLSGRVSRTTFEAHTDDLTAGMLGQAATLASSLINPDSNMIHSVRSGAKGTEINIAQMMGLIGQQFDHGERPSSGRDDRSWLPSFAPGTHPRHRGLVLGGLATGLNQVDWWAHCQSGRSALADTAIGTRRSGALQRNMRCGEQSVFVANDFTVRSSEGTILDLHYGGDDADGKHLHMCPVPWVNATTAKLVDTVQPAPYDVLFRYMLFLREDMNALPRDQPITRGALPFSLENLREAFSNTLSPSEDVPSYDAYMHAVYDMLRMLRAFFPAAPKLPPVRNTTTESAWRGLERLMPIHGPMMLLEGSIIFFLSPMALRERRVSIKGLGEILRVILRNFVRSRISPGELVGLVAAYCKGQRNTQQTLNTFHFTGVKQSVYSVVARTQELLNASTGKVAMRMNVSTWALLKPKLDFPLTATMLQEVIASSDVVPLGSVMDDSILPRSAQALLRAWPDLAQFAWCIKVDVDACATKQIALTDVTSALRASSRVPAIVVSGPGVIVLCPQVKEDGDFARGEDHEAALLLLQHSLQQSVLVSGFKGVRGVRYDTGSVYVPSEGRLKKVEFPSMETLGDSYDVALNLNGVITDFSRCRTNNVHVARSILGVEAAAAVYRRELLAALGTTGYISPRHVEISMAVQFLTGRPLNITSAKAGNSSVIMEAIRGDTLKVLSDGAFFGDVDELNGPSAMSMGVYMRMGTHYSDVVPSDHGREPTMPRHGGGHPFTSRFLDTM